MENVEEEQEFGQKNPASIYLHLDLIVDVENIPRSIRTFSLTFDQNQKNEASEEENGKCYCRNLPFFLKKKEYKEKGREKRPARKSTANSDDNELPPSIEDEQLFTVCQKSERVSIREAKEAASVPEQQRATVPAKESQASLFGQD
jgi:hypothetical protein